MNVTKSQLGIALIMGAVAFGVTLLTISFLGLQCFGRSELNDRISCFLIWNATPISFILGVLATGFTLLATDMLGILSERG